MNLLYCKNNANTLSDKTGVAKSFLFLVALPNTSGSNSPLSYLIGGIIALLIMGYLVYTLLRPDKF